MTVKTIVVEKFPIKLGQFLKLAEITADGIEAKYLIAGSMVLVNNCVEQRRGRKLVAGDRVQVYDMLLVCSDGR
jgi:ribosome-associated protein